MNEDMKYSDEQVMFTKSENDPPAAVFRFVAVGIPKNTTISFLYKYFGQYGEVKFCVMIPSKQSLSAIGDLDDYPQSLESRGNKNVTPNNLSNIKNSSALIEVTDQDTLERVCSRPVYINGQTTSCRPLKTSSQYCEELIQSVIDRKLFIFGLKKSVNEYILHKLFKKHGEIEATRVVRNSNDLRSKGFGFVIFKDPTSRVAALKISSMIYERKLIKWAPYVDIKKQFMSVSDDEGGPYDNKRVWPSSDGIIPIPVVSLSSSPRISLHKRNDLKSDPSFPQINLHKMLEHISDKGVESGSSNRRDYLKSSNRDFPSEYKFNRSRIISSAAVREYFRRRGITRI
jgi:RNA recognition motif-containing protein